MVQSKIKRLENNPDVEISRQELLNNCDDSVNKSDVRDIVIVCDVVENSQKDMETLKWK